jgi:hypothetical protein
VVLALREGSRTSGPGHRRADARYSSGPQKTTLGQPWIGHKTARGAFIG